MLLLLVSVWRQGGTFFSCSESFSPNVDRMPSQIIFSQCGLASQVLFVHRWNAFPSTVPKPAKINRVSRIRYKNILNIGHLSCTKCHRLECLIGGRPVEAGLQRVRVQVRGRGGLPEEGVQQGVQGPERVHPPSRGQVPIWTEQFKTLCMV